MPILLLGLLLVGCAHPGAGGHDASRHPDGAPRLMRDDDGGIIGEWRALAPSPEGCGRYQLVPTREGVAVAQVIQFWNGERFQMSAAGCVPLPR